MIGDVRVTTSRDHRVPKSVLDSFISKQLTTTKMSDVPESALPYPPIHTDKKFVVLTDWSVRDLS